jgi:large repetitive protein
MIYSRDSDRGAEIAVDSHGDAYVFGLTNSEDFPRTPGAFQMEFSSSIADPFITKIDNRRHGRDHKGGK